MKLAKMPFFLPATVRIVMVAIGSLASLLCSYFCVALVYNTIIKVKVGKVNVDVNVDNRNTIIMSNKAAAYDNKYLLYSWGSFNPGYYFSLKKRTNEQFALTNGILWNNNNNKMNKYRHKTNQDELDKFEYIYHDGKSFGIENIIDNRYGLTINASFIIHDNYTWLQHFDIMSIGNEDEKSFMYYFGVDRTNNNIDFPTSSYDLRYYSDDNMNDDNTTSTLHIYGKTKLSSHFYMKFIKNDRTNDNTKAQIFTTTTTTTTNETLPIININSNICAFFTIENSLKYSKNISIDVIYYENNDYFSDDVAIDEAKTMWDDLFSQKLLIQPKFDDLIIVKKKNFNEKFDNTFNLKAKNFTSQDLDVARVALSNVLGGIGWFYGKPRIGNGIDINGTGHAVSLRQTYNSNSDNNISLLTATPSRTSFPRGFLWDEGFHQLLIHHWDINITMQVISDWMSSMNDEGWIPREMILGDEANSRVPDEFITQRTNIANPPTFFLVIENILSSVLNEKEEECVNNSHRLFLQNIFHPLKKWLKWYIISQKGELPGTFRWRGRSYNDNKLVPNTLASGLDDYPRAQLPTSSEYHIDLASWIIKSCHVLLKLNELFNVDGDDQDVKFIKKIYQDTALQYKKLHYSSVYRGYFDYGMISKTAQISSYVHIYCQNTENKMVAEFQVPIEYDKLCPDNYSKYLSTVKIKEKVTSFEPMELQHIPRIGYTTLFPLLLNILEPNCSSLSEILNIIEDPVYLWTEYGLRSLATNDTFYNHPNGPGDNPYWRGPIWININYLTLKALHYYSNTDTIHKTRIVDIYTRLRNNVQNTIIRSYIKTGYFWEQYNDLNGEGIRGHPFTGWTCLLVNIMSEMY